MTFSILARSEDGSVTGIGVATASLATGGVVPFVADDGTVVVSQAFSWPRLGVEAVRALRDGATLVETSARLAEIDRWFAWRQVAMLRRTGELAVHTGAETRPWSGHATGRTCVALGNVLAGEHVVQAMVEAFETAAGDLAARILAALEGGHAAGGQRRDGRQLAERSACLRVINAEGYADIDLRVDIHPTAVAELRRLLETYRPWVAYRQLTYRDPAARPPSDQWERDHPGRYQPPSVFADQG
jgi:uncharacterized Ntn-hydrolase superfamily protein